MRKPTLRTLASNYRSVSDVKDNYAMFASDDLHLEIFLETLELENVREPYKYRLYTFQAGISFCLPFCFSFFIKELNGE